MLPDPFSSPGPDGGKPDGSGTRPGAGADDEVPPEGPEQGLYVCLPAEELTLAGFAQDGQADTMAPGALLATVVDTVTGQDGAGLAGLPDDQLAGLAQSKTFGELRYAAHRLVLTLDPEAAIRRKERARQDAHVRRFREDTGNAGMTARELPPDEVLASWQHVEQRALDLRAAGVPGTLQELRVRAFLDLLQERDARTAPSGGQAGPGEPGPQDAPATAGTATAGTAAPVLARKTARRGHPRAAPPPGSPAPAPARRGPAWRRWSPCWASPAPRLKPTGSGSWTPAPPRTW